MGWSIHVKAAHTHNYGLSALPALTHMGCPCAYGTAPRRHMTDSKIFGKSAALMVKIDCDLLKDANVDAFA